MPQAIIKAVIEAVKAAIMAVREAEGHIKSRRSVHKVPRASGSGLRQLTFDWKIQGSCNE